MKRNSPEYKAWMKEYQVTYRRKNSIQANNRQIFYTKTRKGCLSYIWYRIQSRCDIRLSSNFKGSHKYKGLPYFSKKEFLDWANSTPKFDELFNNWVTSGYKLEFKPSVNRLDSTKGYTIDNIEWLIFIENARGGGYGRKGTRNKKTQSDSKILESLAKQSSSGTEE